MTREELVEKLKTIPTFTEMEEYCGMILIADCDCYITKISTDGTFYVAPNFGILLRKKGDPKILVLDENFDTTDSFNDYYQVKITEDKEVNKLFEHLVKRVKEVREQFNLEKARMDFR